jgi:hypothetical protein
MNAAVLDGRMFQQIFRNGQNPRVRSKKNHLVVDSSRPKQQETAFCCFCRFPESKESNLSRHFFDRRRRQHRTLSHPKRVATLFTSHELVDHVVS